MWYCVGLVNIPGPFPERKNADPPPLPENFLVMHSQIWQIIFLFSGGALRSRDLEMSSTETESLLSSRQDYNIDLSSRQDYYDDTESSITSVSQLAQCKAVFYVYSRVLKTELLLVRFPDRKYCLKTGHFCSVFRLSTKLGCFVYKGGHKKTFLECPKS